jgi:hypothetical protein
MGRTGKRGGAGARAWGVWEKWECPLLFRGIMQPLISIHTCAPMGGPPFLFGWCVCVCA